MIHTDVLIIGAGLLGCFSARELSKYSLSVTVAEQHEDVCCEISKANSGIIYPGYDSPPGSLKSAMTKNAVDRFDELCKTLQVPYRRCGSLMTAEGPQGEATLVKKLQHGRQNGLQGLRIIEKDELHEIEPNLSPSLTKALYSPSPCTVNPWELCIAAYENAAANGVSFRFREPILSIHRDGTDFIAEGRSETFRANVILNCCGLSSSAVREFVCQPFIRLFPTKETYLVFDRRCGTLINHIIFQESEDGKGITMIPTVDGNLLAASNGKDPSDCDFSTDRMSLDRLIAQCSDFLPLIDPGMIIRSFGAVRPNPHYVTEEQGVFIATEKSIHDFTLLEEQGLFSFIGIKTPGLTCCNELGAYAAKKISAYLGTPGFNDSFKPERPAIPRPRDMNHKEWNQLIRQDPAYGRIVCTCEKITEGEIVEAIRRGASSIDGIKRRTGAGMGRCQMSTCFVPILRLMKGSHP